MCVYTLSSGTLTTRDIKKKVWQRKKKVRYDVILFYNLTQIERFILFFLYIYRIQISLLCSPSLLYHLHSLSAPVSTHYTDNGSHKLICNEVFVLSFLSLSPLCLPLSPCKWRDKGESYLIFFFSTPTPAPCCIHIYSIYLYIYYVCTAKAPQSIPQGISNQKSMERTQEPSFHSYDTKYHFHIYFFLSPFLCTFFL